LIKIKLMITIEKMKISKMDNRHYQWSFGNLS